MVTAFIVQSNRSPFQTYLLQINDNTGTPIHTISQTFSSLDTVSNRIILTIPQIVIHRIRTLMNDIPTTLYTDGYSSLYLTATRNTNIKLLQGDAQHEYINPLKEQCLKIQEELLREYELKEDTWEYDI